MNTDNMVWQKGLPIANGRFGHGCSRIAQGPGSNKFSTIIVDGNVALGRTNKVSEMIFCKSCKY
jgi:hypothetical protein